MFSQLSNRESLRDVVLAPQAHASKDYHLGFGQNSFYIFDNVYNDFKRLHNIESIGTYFVIQGNTNNDFKPMKWTRRFLPESGILSDAIGYMPGQLTMEKYSKKVSRVIYLDKESRKSLYSLQINRLSIK